MQSQEIREIFSLTELISFVEVALLSPEHGTAVSCLSIIVAASAMERDALERFLPACLSLVPNVNILQLYITPPVSIAALARVTLPKVEVLKTNLPHRTLSVFVSVHPSLRALELEACGRSRSCAVSSASVQHITEMRCPAECAPRLVHDAVGRLRLDIIRPGLLVSDILKKFPTPLYALDVLTLEFSVSDRSLLRAVAANMPWVRNLKLVENRKPQVRAQQFTRLLEPAHTQCRFPDTRHVRGPTARVGLRPCASCSTCSSLSFAPAGRWEARRVIQPWSARLSSTGRKLTPLSATLEYGSARIAPKEDF